MAIVSFHEQVNGWKAYVARARNLGPTPQRTVRPCFCPSNQTRTQRISLDVTTNHQEMVVVGNGKTLEAGLIQVPLVPFSSPGCSPIRRHSSWALCRSIRARSAYTAIRTGSTLRSGSCGRHMYQRRLRNQSRWRWKTISRRRWRACRPKARCNGCRDVLRGQSEDRTGGFTTMTPPRYEGESMRHFRVPRLVAAGPVHLIRSHTSIAEACAGISTMYWMPSRVAATCRHCLLPPISIFGSRLYTSRCASCGRTATRTAS